MAVQNRVKQILTSWNPSEQDLKFLTGEGLGVFRQILVRCSQRKLQGFPNGHIVVEIIVHDFLMQLDPGKHEFKGQSSFFTYSRAVIFNKCRKLLKRQKKKNFTTPNSDLVKELRVSYSMELDQEDFEGFELNGFDFAIREEVWVKQLKRIAKEFTDSLPPIRLRLLQLFYGKKGRNISWLAIANILNLQSVRTAKAMRDRIRKDVNQYWIPRVISECFPAADHEDQTLTHRVFQLISQGSCEITDVAEDLSLKSKMLKKKLRNASDGFFRFAISQLDNTAGPGESR